MSWVHCEPKSSCQLCVRDSCGHAPGPRGWHLDELRPQPCEQRWALRSVAKTGGCRGPRWHSTVAVRRGQRAEQSEIGLVPFTAHMPFLARSIRGVSCLPGARPGGCATLKCKDHAAADRVQGATVARALRDRPSCSAALRLIHEC
jgi:hypothetical protein